MGKQVLAMLMLLCLSAAGGTAEEGFDGHDKYLLALHLGYAHPLSGALLAPSLGPSATQAPLQ
jgi:hypothetical protein